MTLCVLACVCVCVCVCVCAQSCLTLCDPWTARAPLSMGFFRQEYWGGLPFPPLEDLANPGIKSWCPVSPALQVDSLSTELSGKPLMIIRHFKYP